MKSLHLAILCVIPFFAQAASQASFKAGEYKRTEDLGSLTIKAPNATGFDFEVGSGDASGNVCDLSGHATIKDKVASYTESKCTVVFTSVNDKTVTVDPKNCDDFCGGAATFDGDYKSKAASKRKK